MPSAMTLKGLLCLVALGLCAAPSGPPRAELVATF